MKSIGSHSLVFALLVTSDVASANSTQPDSPATTDPALERTLKLAKMHDGIYKTGVSIGALSYTLPIEYTTMNKTTPPQTDISNEADVTNLVHGFYTKVKEDDLLGPVFSEHLSMDWDDHLPTMISFWSQLLFKTGSYRGNPWLKHVNLTVDKRHFQRWVQLFTATVDDQFSGPKAEQAKNFARSIADTFRTRMGIPPEGVRIPRELKISPAPPIAP